MDNIPQIQDLQQFFASRVQDMNSFYSQLSSSKRYLSPPQDVPPSQPPKPPSHILNASHNLSFQEQPKYSSLRNHSLHDDYYDRPAFHHLSQQQSNAPLQLPYHSHNNNIYNLNENNLNINPISYYSHSNYNSNPTPHAQLINPKTYHSNRTEHSFNEQERIHIPVKQDPVPPARKNEPQVQKNTSFEEVPTKKDDDRPIQPANPFLEDDRPIRPMQEYPKKNRLEEKIPKPWQKQQKELKLQEEAKEYPQIKVNAPVKIDDDLENDRPVKGVSGDVVNNRQEYLSENNRAIPPSIDDDRPIRPMKNYFEEERHSRPTLEEKKGQVKIKKIDRQQKQVRASSPQNDQNKRQKEKEKEKGKEQKQESVGEKKQYLKKGSRQFLSNALVRQSGSKQDDDISSIKSANINRKIEDYMKSEPDARRDQAKRTRVKSEIKLIDKNFENEFLKDYQDEKERQQKKDELDKLHKRIGDLEKERDHWKQKYEELLRSQEQDQKQEQERNNSSCQYNMRNISKLKRLSIKDIGTRIRAEEFEYQKNILYKEYQSHKEGKLLSSSSGKNGKQQKVYQNGKKVIEFANGVRKEMLGNGYSIVYFTNGDVKQLWEDVTIYYFSQANTTQTTLKKGLDVYRFGNGQIEIHNQTGEKEIRFSDGTEKIIDQKGNEEIHFNDGLIQKVGQDKVKHIKYSSQ